MNYNQLVEDITDKLLLEIVKVSLGHPTSHNALYGARYGDAVKKLRFELEDRGFPGAERTSVEPVPHGQSRIMTSVVDTPTIKHIAFQSGRSVPEVEGALKHHTVIGIEPAHPTSGGVKGQAGVVAHEMGHALHNHPYSGANSATGSAEVARETEAWDAGEEFAKHAGMEVDTFMRQSALNRYKADNGLPTEPEAPEATRAWNARAQRKLDSDDDPSTILYGRKKLRGMKSVTVGNINAFLRQSEQKKR